MSGYQKKQEQGLGSALIVEWGRWTHQLSSLSSVTSLFQFCCWNWWKWIFVTELWNVSSFHLAPPLMGSADESMGVLELCPAEDLPWRMRQVGNVSFWDCTAEHCCKLRVIQQNPSACKSASSVTGWCFMWQRNKWTCNKGRFSGRLGRRGVIWQPCRSWGCSQHWSLLS